MRVVGSILRQVVAVENWSCLVSLTSFQDNTGCWFCFLLPYIFVLNHHSFFSSSKDLRHSAGVVSLEREAKKVFAVLFLLYISRHNHVRY